MRQPLGSRRRTARILTFLLLVLTAAAVPAAAATPISVATARATQDGSSATVRGYVVGQPTSSTTVVTSGFPNDYALALADAPRTADTSRMLYVQIPSAFRSAWGLRTNPSLMGRQLDITGTGEYDGTCYAAAIGKTGSALESSLHTIISSGDTVLSYDAVWNALKVTDRDPADGSRVICLQWNREHVWAKPHGDFGAAAGPGTDLHHLRPEDVTVNSARGNLDFDEGGSQNSEAPGNFADADSWEPRDPVKGDVVGNGTAPHLGRLSVLLRWNAEDPPSAFEMRPIW